MVNTSGPPQKVTTTTGIEAGTHVDDVNLFGSTSLQLDANICQLFQFADLLELEGSASKNFLWGSGEGELLALSKTWTSRW